MRCSGVQGAPALPPPSAGGHLDDGESCEQALARELREELGISVREEALRPLAFASDPAQGRGSIHLLLPAFVADQWEGEPSGVEGSSWRGWGSRSWQQYGRTCCMQHAG